ncbi:hypothetical protein DWB61_15050 [Ancylomarina euxinus]|uniref:Uncharacterized protein n=2 Tax=Ancylomarina euxinus TaxID=2283627 RepID=A0A425XXT0_9BACT|nr:hypothetical protein DWB61_15050 [Ancylomarina euxinus]
MFSFLLALSNGGYCQYESILEERIVGRVLDTLEVNENNTVVHTLWLSDTLKVVVQNEHLKYDFKSTEKGGEKRSFSLTERKNYIKDLKTWGQNCFSSALEHCLARNGLAQQAVFNKRTLIGLETFSQILNHYFIEVKAFNTLSKQNFKTKMPDNALLTFSSQAGKLIHAVYFTEGLYYSKSAGSEATEFINLKNFIKENYNETQLIKIYQFDKARFDLALNK